jgi:enterochelin esterase-like enzyme
MKNLIFPFLILFLLSVQKNGFTQVIPEIKAEIAVTPEMRQAFQKGGRLILHLTKKREREPRSHSEITIGVTPENWDASQLFIIDTKNKGVLANGLDNLSGQEKYYYQAVYKQNIDDGNENVAGNIFSEVDSVVIDHDINIQISLKKMIPPLEIIDHEFVRSLVIKSQLLSEFSGYPRYLKASVLLPSGYFDHPLKTYPICYRVPGLNGRYNGVNGRVQDKDFSDWWFSKTAPQIIYVFLDSQGPYGDTYQVDSENNGPCGKALTEELIPKIEKLVHYDPSSKMRFLCGKSTGGWVALGLQIFYPDFFDGSWSYSPDPVDFEHYGLINIYNDETIFYNKYGYLQPGKRTTNGEPTFSMKDWIANENVNSRTNDYRISGGQFGAYNAVFGPKGKDGLPSMMFDPVTGKIDHAIAKQWEKYDLKKVLEKNWTTLGPKLQGKIWIWTGDMDGLYSNVATRFLKMYLDKTENPKSDAKISFTPMAGHTQEWSDVAVLTMIAEKVSKIKK